MLMPLFRHLPWPSERGALTRDAANVQKPVSRRTVLAGTVAGVLTTAVASPRAAAAPPGGAGGPSQAATSPRSLRFPTTRLARRAYRVVVEAEEPFLRNHSLRSFLFGRAAAARQGVRPGHDYDPELMFLICVLHDLGLAAPATTDRRFEVAGADHAAQLLQDEGAADSTVDTVWWAIASHTTPQIGDSAFLRRRQPEIGIAQSGIGIDLDGPELLPPGFADRVHRAYPRLGGGRALFDAIEAQALTNPAVAPPTTLAGELVHQRDPRLPYFRLDDVLDANRWGD